MARPVVHARTERLYASLPALYRAADEAQAFGDNGYPLLRYLDLIGEQAGELEDLYDRIAYVPADVAGAALATFGNPLTSDLVDPDTADAEWLPWLAQLVGVRLRPLQTEQEQRDTIAGASTGWRAGTRAAIEAVAASTLAGDRDVDVLPNYLGDEWVLGIRTRPDETPDPAATLAAIVNAEVKPAGVELVHVVYAASWDTIEAAYASWDELEAGAPTWDALEST